MKKIGIVTHYYKSLNYGGNLQAYALCAFLNKQGHQAEQICLLGNTQTLKERLKMKGVLWVIKATLRRIGDTFFIMPFRKVAQKLENKKHAFQQRKRQAFEHFNQNIIPHSEKVYGKGTVKECVSQYQAFITGSDQVWNFHWYHPAYFLDFVPSEKTKLSYAASVAMSSFTAQQAQMVQDSLKDYKAVSVREKSAEKLLQNLSPVPPKTVLDPTLLLTKEDWDKVCAERVVKEEYIFCYFLGNNPREKTLAKQFAKERGLAIVTVPQRSQRLQVYDKKFGDVRLYDASPEQFLSLIKHASYVFTDSFHAVVFSNIYQKQYFVFNRSKKGEMSSRIVHITQLFHQEERFCAGSERENLPYVLSLSRIDYTKENQEFQTAKAESIAFLQDNLKD